MEISKSQVAYCSQTPWLANSSVMENIIGFSTYEKDWYDKVVSACALEKDIEQLPHGRHTVVGSQGVALSGGQKQRLVSFHYL